MTPPFPTYEKGSFQGAGASVRLEQQGSPSSSQRPAYMTTHWRDRCPLVSYVRDPFEQGSSADFGKSLYSFMVFITILNGIYLTRASTSSSFLLISCRIFSHL